MKPASKTASEKLATKKPASKPAKQPAAKRATARKRSSWRPSEQPALSEGQCFRAPDHEMVQYPKVDGAEHRLEPLREPLIGLGQLRHAGRVVVVEDDGRGIQRQGAIDDFARLDAGAVDGAPEQLLDGDDRVLVVKEEASEYLVLQVPDLKLEAGCEKALNRFGRSSRTMFSSVNV